MRNELYYTPPPDEQFEELRKSAIELWGEIADEESYKNEKIKRIKKIENIEDNFMYIVAMFDSGNQRKLSKMISAETRFAIRERMISGGTPEWITPF